LKKYEPVDVPSISNTSYGFKCTKVFQTVQHEK
jgi:hypothetical protein